MYKKIVSCSHHVGVRVQICDERLKTQIQSQMIEACMHTPLHIPLAIQVLGS
jgi:hypothetical protein